MTNQIKTLAKQLRPIFTRYADIQAVYLFGSTVTGHQHPNSDLDLALVPRSNTLRRQKLDILTDLARAGFDNVDLLILDTNDIVLKYEAVRFNRVIYHTDDFEPAVFFSNVVRQYLDFVPYLEVQRQAYKQRILNGQTGGFSETVE
ncbi:MAG: nucleotidyltransferase domain-containing protein [Chloroflexi bacterium]|nr:MAG: nucleotidyltransferase domain-containing protein [Chloroflexota bacterium]